MSHGRRKSDNEEASGAYSYSNAFSIGYNGYVFIFEFGMTDSRGNSHVRSRLVINPAHAEQFRKMLADALDQHVIKYGPIKAESQEDPDCSREGCGVLVQPAASCGERVLTDTHDLRRSNLRVRSTVAQ